MYFKQMLLNDIRTEMKQKKYKFLNDKRRKNEAVKKISFGD